MSTLFPTWPDRVTPMPQSLFSETYGGSLVSCMIMLPLYGLSILQTYMYFLNYERDPLSLKLLVSFVWVLETLHAAFVCHAVYHYTIFSYSNPLELIHSEWSLDVACSCGAIICSLIQIYFAKMIYHMTKNKWRFIIITVFAVAIVVQLASITRMRFRFSGHCFFHCL